jgi:hypothetical protein
VARLAGGVRKNDQELTTGPMVSEIWVGTAPVRGSAEAGRGRRWNLGAGEGGSTAGATSKLVSFRLV